MSSLADRTMDYFETLARLTREAAATDHTGQPKTLADGIADFITRGRAAHEAGNKLIFIGNGASASMASAMRAPQATRWRTSSSGAKAQWPSLR